MVCEVTVGLCTRNMHRSSSDERCRSHVGTSLWGSFTVLRRVRVTAYRVRRPGSQDVKPVQQSRQFAGDQVVVRDLRLTRTVTLSG